MRREIASFDGKFLRTLLMGEIRRDGIRRLGGRYGETKHLTLCFQKSHGTLLTIRGALSAGAENLALWVSLQAPPPVGHGRQHNGNWDQDAHLRQRKRKAGMPVF